MHKSRACSGVSARTAETTLTACIRWNVSDLADFIVTERLLLQGNPGQASAGRDVTDSSESLATQRALL
jgi:hypothetical protein